jgi:NAD(P)-dependent dehydrogenase (short-subunit alcohol dehydrogenase family)
MTKMTDLNGKVVTGSSRGIEAEIAVAFARQSAKVVLHGRDTEALAKVEADITNRGGHAMFVTGDVPKFADIEAIRARIEQTYGLVDVLGACVGGRAARSDEHLAADFGSNAGKGKQGGADPAHELMKLLVGFGDLL